MSFKSCDRSAVSGLWYDARFYSFGTGGYYDSVLLSSTFWVIILLVLLYGVSLKKAVIARLLTNKYWWMGIIGLFLVVYLYRMVQYFPHQAPLDFNFNAFLPRLWQIVAT